MPKPLEAALPRLTPKRCLGWLTTSSPAAAPATRSRSTEAPIMIPAQDLIAASLARTGLAGEADSITAIRRAMSLPVADRRKPLEGVIELLEEINALGLRTIIASNTYWRDADSYWQDFRDPGMASNVDGIATSVDAGHLKPPPAVFEMAMRVARAPASRCVFMGNREENDIEPAIALGMRTILVHPDDPPPSSSRGQATAPNLWSCATALKAMLDES